MSDSLGPARLLCPWNSLGKNTCVGCHSRLHEPRVSFIAGKFFIVWATKVFWFQGLCFQTLDLLPSTVRKFLETPKGFTFAHHLLFGKATVLILSRWPHFLWSPSLKRWSLIFLLLPGAEPGVLLVMNSIRWSDYVWQQLGHRRHWGFSPALFSRIACSLWGKQAAAVWRAPHGEPGQPKIKKIK